MASSNQVRIATIKESSYGVTPGAGDFKQVRFTSESLSGSPDTTESALIRTDRLSSGQIVTGLTVGGSINTELAKDTAIDELMESAMFNTWITDTPVVVTLTIDTTAKTITRAAGDWAADDVEVGFLLVLGGFSNAGNNTQVMVKAINSATVIQYVGPDTLVDEVGDGETFRIADRLEIGTKNTRVSLSIEKSFEDITDKAINYRGNIVNSMSVNATYGAIVTATFELLGNGHEPVDAAVDFMTNGRTIGAPATTNPLNGSVDMPFFAESSSGSLVDDGFCVQSIEVTLNNNLNPQTCIGRAAPEDLTEGTANVGVNLTAYLSDTNWTLLASKLDQTPIAVGYMLKNSGGYYGFYLPAVQLSFDDPSSAGQNQDVFLNASGVGKVGATGEKSLYIFKS